MVFENITYIIFYFILNDIYKDNFRTNEKRDIYHIKFDSNNYKLSDEGPSIKGVATKLQALDINTKGDRLLVLMLDPSTDMLEKLAGKKIFPIFSGRRVHLASTIVLESTINNNFELLLIKNPFGHAFSYEKFS